jgi:hypothetical protein
MRKFLSHRGFPGIRRILLFRWYRFQNSTTVKDNDLKFYMVIVLGKLEDPMQVFLPEIVQKLPKFLKFVFISLKDFQ